MSSGVVMARPENGKALLKPMVLTVGQRVLFEDGLGIELQGFSHKRPRVGGPTMATAYLRLHPVKGDAREMRLSVHGREGQEGQRFERERFSREYEFSLTAFSYDESIEVTVRRWDVKMAVLGQAFTLASDDLVMFENGLKVRFRAPSRTLEIICDELGGGIDSVRIDNFAATRSSLEDATQGVAPLRYGRSRIHILSVEADKVSVRVEQAN